MTGEMTRAQKRVAGEISEIIDHLGVGVLNLDQVTVADSYIGDPFLIDSLKYVRNEIIRAAVVTDYTYVDELLGTIIARYFFGQQNWQKLWRTKRFKRFSYYILERLYLLQKLDLVRDLRPIPRDVIQFVERLNSLRNALAHAFFPENLRGHRTTYNRTDIFSIEGFRSYAEDRATAIDYLFKRAFN